MHYTSYHISQENFREPCLFTYESCMRDEGVFLVGGLFGGVFHMVLPRPGVINLVQDLIMRLRAMESCIRSSKNGLLQKRSLNFARKEGLVLRRDGFFLFARLQNIVSSLGLPLFVAIFVDHENGGNRGKRRDDTCKASWMNETL